MLLRLCVATRYTYTNEYARGGPKQTKMKKTKKSIRISKEHGLNPSIAVCFFCGKDKGIVALGALKGDAKAPQRAMYDYKPCEECAKRMQQGTTVIEVVTHANGTAPIMDGAWPTGRWCIIADDTAKELFKHKWRKKMLLADNLYEYLVRK